ncbi:MAG: amidohydrolase family protein [Candidatus Binatia bacterium]
MSTNHAAETAKIHARLNHPVIDSDGHWIEFEPAAEDYLKQVGGDRVVERYGKVANQFGNKKWAQTPSEERRERRMLQPGWWGVPTKNTRDRATAMLPKLLHERMGELGLDFAVIYPTSGALFAPFLRDEEVRRAACRAFNMYTADQFKGLGDRLAPAAVIPMYTPQEAVEELEFVVKNLGSKAVMLGSLMRRPVPAVAKSNPDASRYAIWHDLIGLDSAHDYDPVWAKCQELGIPPSFHSASSGIGLRTSISNFVYNHIGHFGQAGEAVCKALFIGGVTRRFPKLKFAFLEGGVGWACSLYSDLIGHWKKRNADALDAVNPANLNRDMLTDLVKQYGSAAFINKLDKLAPGVGLLMERPEQHDDFAACGIKTAEDIRDLFVPNFYFGCESDDPVTSWAFKSNVNPFGAKLGALFGSDIGHFDVPDMTEVLVEAYEGVEDGVLSEEDFHDFVFGNPVRFWAGMNPNFFKGTAVESQVQKFMKENGTTTTAAAAL